MNKDDKDFRFDFDDDNPFAEDDPVPPRPRTAHTYTAEPEVLPPAPPSVLLRSAQTVGAIFSPIVFIIAIALLAEAFAPPELKPTGLLSRIAANANNTFLGLVVKSQANYQAELAAAVKQVEVEYAAKLALYQAHYQTAYGVLQAGAQSLMQAEMTSLQLAAQAKQQTLAARTYGGNVADTGCMVGQLFGMIDQSFATGWAQSRLGHLLNQGCGAGETLRESVVEELEEEMKHYRGNILQTALRDLPSPESLPQPKLPVRGGRYE